MKITVIGMGIIGRGIYKNLIASGYDVNAYNRTKMFDDCYKSVGQNIQEAVSDADVIISTLSDDIATDEVWFTNQNNIMKYMKENTVCVMVSTLSNDFINKWNETVSMKAKTISCPVTGSREGAENGTLTLFLGGDKEIVDKLSEVFKSFGEKTFYIGTVEMAMRFKLIYNLMGGMILNVLTEIISYVDTIPLDKNKFLDIITDDINWGTRVANSKGFRIINDEHDNVDAYLSNMIKDVIYGTDLIGSNARSMLSKTSKEIYTDPILRKYHSKDMSALYHYYSDKETK